MAGCSCFAKHEVVILYPSKLFPELVVSFLSFGFFIATVAYPVKNDAPRSALLIALLIVISILSGSAGYARYASDRQTKAHYAENSDQSVLQWGGVVKLFLQPSRSVFILLHGSAFVLLLILTARLYGVENFRTQPTNLEFGPKDGIIQNDGSYEENIAFSPRFSSFGHAIQGVLAALLSFPAVSGSLAHLIGRIGMRGSINFNRTRIVLVITRLAYSLLTLYPTYNLIKRVIKSYPIFATTSYANNSLEWSMGYGLGLALGMLLTNITRWLLIVFLPQENEGGLEAFKRNFDISNEELPNKNGGLVDEETVPTIVLNQNERVAEEKYVFGKLEEYAPNTAQSKSCLSVDFSTFVIGFSNFVLGAFTLTTLLCGIFMGKSWNTCLEVDGDDCINSTKNGIDVGQRLTVTFTMSFISIMLMFTAISSRMKGA